MSAHTSVVEAGASVDSTALLGPFVIVQSGARIGAGVVVHGCTIIPGNVRVENDVRVFAGAQFVADPTGPTVISRGASLRSNSVISAGVTVGAHAVVMPSSFVDKSVPSGAVVQGSPAHIVGYVGVADRTVTPVADHRRGEGRELHGVRGVVLHEFARVTDIRGSLIFGEFQRAIPFDVKRYFLVFDVPSLETRGEHAHKECHQFLVCVRGRCSVVADDGRSRAEFTLDRPDLGLHLSPMVWATQYKYSSDAMLLVFASHYYDAKDYIRNYDDFIAAVGSVRDSVS